MAGRLSHTVPAWQRRSALAGGVFFVICALGCMSLNIGGRTEMAPPADAQVQQGTVTIPAHQSLDVYYPNPFVTTPNLLVENSWNDCKIEEQQPNHFRISNPGLIAREITWKARGEKVPVEVLQQSVKAGLGKPGETPVAASKVK
jgi:hypothetical protein